MKIRRVLAELFHADGLTEPDGFANRQTERQADMTKLIVALRNFAKTAKK